MESLIEAIKANDVGKATSLLTELRKLANARDDDDRTPLHWAATFNQPEMAKLLLSFGAEIEEDSNGWTPIHIACSMGSIDMFNILKQSLVASDLNATTVQGVTPLNLAVSKNHYDLVKEMLQNGATCRNKSKYGLNLLHRAASIGSEPLVRLLIQNGARVNVTDNEGWTPLHHALAEGCGDVALVLVELGADKNIENNDGKAAVQVAVDENVAKWFQQRSG